MTQFTIKDTQDGVALIHEASGDEIASFNGLIEYNIAFLAFIEGIRKVPEATVWSESKARYIVQAGVVDAEYSRQSDFIGDLAVVLNKALRR
jgi:hypothetical protein